MSGRAGTRLASYPAVRKAALTRAWLLADPDSVLTDCLQQSGPQADLRLDVPADQCQDGDLGIDNGAAVGGKAARWSQKLPTCTKTSLLNFLVVPKALTELASLAKLSEQKHQARHKPDVAKAKPSHLTAVPLPLGQVIRWQLRGFRAGRLETGCAAVGHGKAPVFR